MCYSVAQALHVFENDQWDEYGAAMYEMAAANEESYETDNSDASDDERRSAYNYHIAARHVAIALY